LEALPQGPFENGAAAALRLACELLKAGDLVGAAQWARWAAYFSTANDTLAGNLF
jgi:hypothetical protein